MKSSDQSQQEPPLIKSYSHWEACTAILKGLDDNANSQASYYDYSFAEWENPGPPFMQLFKSKKGLVSKVYTKNDNDDTWSFNLMIYDGYVVDSRFAQVQINIKQSMLSVYAGTYTSIEKIRFTIATGDFSQVQNEKVVAGQIEISFINIKTNKPFISQDANDANLRDYTFQLNFLDHPDYGTIKTSSFSKKYPVIRDDTRMVTLIYVGLSVLLSCFSWYTKALNQKVTVTGLQAFFAATSYIVYWTVIHIRYLEFMSLWHWLLLIPPVFNWIKLIVFIITNKNKFSSPTEFIGTLILIPLVALLNHVPLTWMKILDIFPIIMASLPVMKIIERKEGDLKAIPYSRFELPNYFHTVLWMAYAYAYPGNIYFLDLNWLLVFYTVLWTFMSFLFFCAQRLERFKNHTVNDTDYKFEPCSL